MSYKTVAHCISAWVYPTVLIKKDPLTILLFIYFWGLYSSMAMLLWMCPISSRVFILSHWLCVASPWLTELSSQLVFVYYSFMFLWLPWSLQITFIINLSLFLNKCADLWPWISMSFINNKIILISVFYPCIVLQHLATTICIHSTLTTDIYIKSDNLYNMESYSQLIWIYKNSN